MAQILGMPTGMKLGQKKIGPQFAGGGGAFAGANRAQGRVGPSLVRRAPMTASTMGTRDPGGNMMPTVSPLPPGSNNMAGMISPDVGVQTNPAPAVAPGAGMASGAQDLLRKLLAARRGGGMGV